MPMGDTKGPTLPCQELCIASQLLILLVLHIPSLNSYLLYVPTYKAEED